MFICVCHVTWISFPSFFYCIPDNGWKLCLLCCWDAVGSELQQGYLAMSGAEGGSQDLLLRFGVGEEGENVGVKALLGCTGDQPALCLLWNQQNTEITWKQLWYSRILLLTCALFLRVIAKGRFCVCWYSEAVKIFQYLELLLWM